MGRFDCIRRSESVQVSLSQTVRRIVFLVCQKRPLSAYPRKGDVKVTVSHVTSEHIALSQTLPGFGIFLNICIAVNFSLFCQEFFAPVGTNKLKQQACLT